MCILSSKGKSGQKFLSVSASYELVPLVPGPEGVWRAADLDTKHNRRLQKRDSLPLLAARGAGGLEAAPQSSKGLGAI